MVLDARFGLHSDRHLAKSEAFYWTTIMFSQTLGTALGDWMADDTGLGYNGSALVIAVVLAVIAALYFVTRHFANATVLGGIYLNASIGSHHRQFIRQAGRPRPAGRR